VLSTARVHRYTVKTDDNCHGIDHAGEETVLLEFIKSFSTKLEAYIWDDDMG